MMTKLSARRGSALLIVLGMVAVMVISAVAFSAYMRYSRLPSSFLRRTSASRHLAHAAMAEAIDIIDASIGDNPHPGFPHHLITSRSGDRNYWIDRCYVGVNTNNLSNLPSPSATVPVLTLEALAYIPPDIVNHARYYSRRSTAAKWHNFDYDAGRFAFCAIDVSDHLDVNRVFANCGRDSSDDGKFSLAFAFENSDHDGYSFEPSDWDGIGNGGLNVPFISLADIGLASKGSKVDKFFPAISAIDQNDSSLLDGIMRDDVKCFNVVADGLYPSVAKDSNRPGDISRRQPFKTISKGKRPAADVVNKDLDDKLRELLGGVMQELDIVALYDYLDENNVPVSLALPTVERVPMICALQPDLGIDFKPRYDQDPPVYDGGYTADDAPDGTEYHVVSKCGLTVALNARLLHMLCMFPFRTEKDRPNGKFNVETAFKVCFGEEGKQPSLQQRSNSRYFSGDAADFKKKEILDSVIFMNAAKEFPSTENVEKPKDAIEALDLSPEVDFSWFDDEGKGKYLFKVTKYYKVRRDSEGRLQQPEELPDKTEVWVNDGFTPVDEYGQKNKEALEKALKEGNGFTIRPYMSAASRITQGSDTVDLVPASNVHDKYNGGSEDDYFVSGMQGNQYPVIMFRGDKEIMLGLNNFEDYQKNDTTITVKFSPSDGMKSIYCPDPRWNFLPENFVCVQEAIETIEQWFDSDNADATSRIGVNDKDTGTDRDIFMFISNQGYMQSVSELAFLPRTITGDMGDNDLVRYGHVKVKYSRDDIMGKYQTEPAKTPNWDLMWRTYRLYPQSGLSSDGLYDIGLFDGGTGFRMNPYTASREARLSALANPPCSWWAASTNYNAEGKSSFKDMSAAAFNEKHAFCEMNSKAKFAWEDMEKIAGRIGEAMRSNSNGDWCSGYDSLDWAGDDDHFAGVQLSSKTCDLYDVDRKFLYGFWRDCFAAKQQLFLVFVRAEPLMMGSGAAGKAPPPLGARAMALVWRKPAAGSETGVAGGKKAWPDSLSNTRAAARDSSGGGSVKEDLPHETRILFYRQFD